MRAMIDETNDAQFLATFARENTSTDPTPRIAVPASSDPHADRIRSIDVLRGFALLGILVVNIQSFAMVEAAYFNPTAYGDLSGVNRWVWALTHTLADQKMMTIFGMLFGAGIVLMAAGRERTGRSAAAAHYRRMAALIPFGLVHAYCLWHGDILVTYALCGMVAYPFRRLRPALLLPIGVFVLSIASGLFLLAGWSIRFWPPETISEFSAEMAPSSEMIAAELATYRGNWLRQMHHRLPTALMFQTFIFGIWAFWRALGLMLIGMALFKLGVFSAERPTRFYAALFGVGLLIGVPLICYGAYRSFEYGWESPYTFFISSQFNYWASLLVALGWVGAVMFVCRANGRASVAVGPLAAVGRLALSNYLLQTILCTTLFYGHGFGLFGRVERIGQLAIVVAIWALQLVWSPLWLRRFTMGPAEWLWRSLTYGKMSPLRRPAAAARPAPVG